MPRIVAVVNDENEKPLLHSMMNSIKHEDWYLLDSYVAEEFTIGRVQLGILNPESQPIFNEDKSLGIFMDREIYDYPIKKKNLESKGACMAMENYVESQKKLSQKPRQQLKQSLNSLVHVF